MGFVKLVYSVHDVPHVISTQKYSATVGNCGFSKVAFQIISFEDIFLINDPNSNMTRLAFNLK